MKDTKAIAAHEVMPVPGLSPSAYLGVLGMTGMTAYCALGVFHPTFPFPFVEE